MTVLYWIANLCGLVGMVIMIVGMYGRENSRVYRWPRWQAVSLRSSMVAVIVGHAYCVIDMGTPTIGEVILACGLGFLFPWTAWYHWRLFVVKYRESIPFSKGDVVEGHIS